MRDANIFNIKKCTLLEYFRYATDHLQHIAKGESVVPGLLACDLIQTNQCAVGACGHISHVYELLAVPPKRDFTYTVTFVNHNFVFSSFLSP